MRVPVCPNRPRASSRALLRGCGAPISHNKHLQRRAMVPLASRLPASQALPSFARSREKPINQTVSLFHMPCQPRQSIYSCVFVRGAA